MKPDERGRRRAEPAEQMEKRRQASRSRSVYITSSAVCSRSMPSAAPSPVLPAIRSARPRNNLAPPPRCARTSATATSTATHSPAATGTNSPLAGALRARMARPMPTNISSAKNSVVISPKVEATASDRLTPLSVITRAPST